MNFYDPDPLRLSRERHELLLRQAGDERLAAAVRPGGVRRGRRALYAGLARLARASWSYSGLARTSQRSPSSRSARTA
jgi:hypothetical protein